MMTGKEYFHLCSDGNRTPDFIISRKDYVAAMNIVALCAANTEAGVVAFTLEDTHIHLFLFGTRKECVRFKDMFEGTYCRYAARNRDGIKPFSLRIEIYETGNEEDYVRKLAAYTVIQPTKDGKHIMPFDYPWGSGSLYFRCNDVPQVWACRDGRMLFEPVRFGSLTKDLQQQAVHSRTHTIPASWLVCDGIILPTNYVDIPRFESIFRSHNSYRVFLAGSRSKEMEILQRMAQERGVMLEDLEARKICSQECKILYGIRDPRKLSGQSRIAFAQTLRKKYRMTIRQIASLVRLPESEVMTYVP